MSVVDDCNESTGDLKLRTTGDDAHAPDWNYQCTATIDTVDGIYIGYCLGDATWYTDGDQGWNVASVGWCRSGVTTSSWNNGCPTPVCGNPHQCPMDDSTLPCAYLCVPTAYQHHHWECT